MSSTQRIVIVIGKGGVGKSTVAAALGLKAAREGRRTIVAEIGGRGNVQRMFDPHDLGAGATPSERELAPNLFTIGIEPERALEEYLADQLPVRALAGLLGGSRTLGYVTAATPGLRELLCIGKVWELAQPERRAAGEKPYDLVILDGPATGHGVALLAAPRTFARAAQVGPIARQGARIDATLRDRDHTGIVAVCTPHEAAVNETLETRARLADELGIAPGDVIVNALRPRRFATRDIPRLRAAQAQAQAQAEAEVRGRSRAGARAVAAPEQTALRLALSEHRRVNAERVQLRRVQRAANLDRPPTELPFVYASEIGADELARLSGQLGQA